jgi:hypothetical protein
MPRVLAILAVLAMAATAPAGCGSSQPPAMSSGGQDAAWMANLAAR